MNTVAILLATSLLGVDYELVTADSKETVYVITIERELIDQLADGFTINLWEKTETFDELSLYSKSRSINIYE